MFSANEGIPSDLLRRLRTILVRCEQFESNDKLKRVFVDKRIAIWKSRVPEADNAVDRVDSLINYLHDRRKAGTGENALRLFVQVLADLQPALDDLRGQLLELAKELQAALESNGAEDTPEALHPCHSVNVALLTETLPTAYYYQLKKEAFPLVSVEIDNLRRNCTDIAVRVQAVIEGFSDPDVTTSQVPHGAHTKLVLLPLLRQEAIATLNEMRPATLGVSVEQTAPVPRLLYERTFQIRLHARNTALLAVQRDNGETVDLVNYLAAWVTPRSEVIEKLLRSAAKYHPRHRIVGYQGHGTLEERATIVRAQAQAIFAALKQEASLTYINSTLNIGRQAGQVTQRVRLPSESLAVGGAANCIDGAVLFASLLESASIDPFIVIVPGHAFVGWRVWRGVDQYEFLETTLIGSDDFDRAQQVAKGQYDDVLMKGYFNRELYDPAGFARLIDIASCRAQGILPLE